MQVQSDNKISNSSLPASDPVPEPDQTQVPQNPKTVHDHLIVGMGAFPHAIARGAAGVFGGLSFLILGIPSLGAKIVKELSLLMRTEKNTIFKKLNDREKRCESVINGCLKLPLLCLGYAKTGTAEGATKFEADLSKI